MQGISTEAFAVVFRDLLNAGICSGTQPHPRHSHTLDTARCRSIRVRQRFESPFSGLAVSAPTGANFATCNEDKPLNHLDTSVSYNPAVFSMLSQCCHLERKELPHSTRPALAVVSRSWRQPLHSAWRGISRVYLRRPIGG